MTGRPSSYSPELADTICAQLADGRSLRTVCDQPGMPSRQTVFRWLREREDFRDQYARAKEEAADALVDDMLEISDQLPAYKQSAEGQSIDAGDIAHRKLQVDTRRWIASKLKPKRYGDKLEIEGKQDMTLNVTIKRLAAPDVPALPEPGETE